MIKMMISIAVLSFSLLVTMPSEALPVDTYQFNDEVTKKRFNALTKELRCPKCQNQNLADSNSPIAADLRREVYELLMLGKADSEIVSFMVERYGDFVLYRPRMNSATYILWFGPAILLFIGVVIVVMVIRKRPQQATTKAELSEEQKSQLAQILKDK